MIHTGLFNNNKNIFEHIFIALCGFILLTGCKSSSTEPVASYKTPDEMTWTVDTLYTPGSTGTAMYGICGVSANNIYIYGQNSATLGSNIMHYDGNQWSPLWLRNYIAYSSVEGMMAFSADNVWFAGTGLGAEIIHYNGSNYVECWPSEERMDELLCIAGNRSDNMYAAGRNGIVLQYTGSSWRVDRIKMNVPSGGGYYIRSAAMYKDTCYMLVQAYDSKSRFTHYFIKGNFKNWAVVDSVVENGTNNWKWGWWGLYTTPDNKLLSCGDQGVWEYTGGKWNKLPFESRYLISSVFSTGNNYTVAVGHKGTAYFSDGTGWKKLERFDKGYEDVSYSGIWGDGKELFIIGISTSGIIGSNDYKTLVFHGK